MPRITPVRTKDQVEEQYYGVFDAIAESRGEVRGPFSLLMHSPELAGRAAHLGAYIRFEGALDNATMETAIISAAREFNCGYEWGAHVAMARQAGVPETTIAAIRSTQVPVSVAMQVVSREYLDGQLSTEDFHAESFAM